MRFSILTCTYNRGELLRQIYNSLLAQSFTDFEWIIIDDGSTDDTAIIVELFQKASPFFPIVYRKTENGGKHRAWNLGVSLASGELIVGCDSDDYFTKDALLEADKIEKSIPQSQKKDFAGICGLRAYRDSSIIGKTFNEDYKDVTHLNREGAGITGDRSEIIYTNVWKKYKYREFEGETFLTEATSLNLMAADGLLLRYYNKIVKLCEYRTDGLTAKGREGFLNNPKGWGMFLGQQIKYKKIRGIKKYYKLWEYYDYGIFLHMSKREIADNLDMNPIELYMNVMVWRIVKKLKRA